MQFVVASNAATSFKLLLPALVPIKNRTATPNSSFSRKFVAPTLTWSDISVTGHYG